MITYKLKDSDSSLQYNTVIKLIITVTVSLDDVFFSFSFFDDNVDDKAFSDDEFNSNNTDVERVFKNKKKQYDKNYKIKKSKSSVTERQKQFIKNKKKVQKTVRKQKQMQVKSEIIYCCWLKNLTIDYT